MPIQHRHRISGQKKRKYEESELFCVYYNASFEAGSFLLRHCLADVRSQITDVRPRSHSAPTLRAGRFIRLPAGAGKTGGEVQGEGGDPVRFPDVGVSAGYFEMAANDITMEKQ